MIQNKYVLSIIARIKITPTPSQKINQIKNVDNWTMIEVGNVDHAKLNRVIGIWTLSQLCIYILMIG